MPNNYNPNGGNPGTNTFYPNSNPGQYQSTGYQPQNPGYQNAPSAPNNGMYQQNPYAAPANGYNNAFQNQNQNVNTNMYQQPRVKASQLAPDTQLIVRGKINFCRLNSAYEGEELAKYNQRQNANNKPSRATPFIQVAIENPVISPITTDPMAIQYLNSHFYNGQDGLKKFQQSFTVSSDPARRKAVPFLNVVNGVAAGGWFQMNPNQELNKGCDVALIMSTYAAKGNTGIRLNGVIVYGKIEYYERGNNVPSNDLLAALGITIQENAPVQNQGFQPMPENAVPTADPYTNSQTYGDQLDTSYGFDDSDAY